MAFKSLIVAVACCWTLAAFPAAGNHKNLCTEDGKCVPLPKPVNDGPTDDGTGFKRFVVSGWQDWRDSLGRHLMAGGSTTQVDTVADGTTRAMAIVRLLPNGQPDLSLNGTGIVELPVWGTSGEMAFAVAVLPDHKILVAGNTSLPCKEFESWACDAGFIVVTRLLDDGRVDYSYGARGRTILRVGIGYAYDAVGGLRPGPDGSVVVLDAERVPIAQLDAAGALDTEFTGCGLSQPETRCVATAFDLELAVEFYNAERDHYFVTTLPQELAALDKGVFRGWTRTDRAVAVYPSRQSSRAQIGEPVCRFYGSATAGLDTHFYSGNPAECAALAARADGAWIEESPDVFRLGRPNSSGACDAGSQPVYRLWNGRADVNHRFVTSRHERDAMVARGIISEVDGPEQVTLCAPMFCAPGDRMCQTLLLPEK